MICLLISNANPWEISQQLRSKSPESMLLLIRKQSLQQEQVVQKMERLGSREANRDTGEVTEDSLRCTNVSCLIEK